MNEKSSPSGVARVIEEIVAGDGIGLPQAAQLLPPMRGCSRKHPVTLLSWVKKGCVSTTGNLIKLEAARVGMKWITSRAAVKRFLSALTEESGATHTPTVTYSKGVDQKRAKAASTKLAASGA